MKIDIHNYEEFALDYLEGALDEKQSQAFEAFLSKNPEVAKSLETLMEFKLQPDVAIVFEDKNALIQNRKSKAWLGLLVLMLALAGAGLWSVLGKNGYEKKTEIIVSTSTKSETEAIAVEATPMVFQDEKMPMSLSKNQPKTANQPVNNASTSTPVIKRTSVSSSSLPTAISPEVEYAPEVPANDNVASQTLAQPQVSQAEPVIHKAKAPETAIEKPRPKEEMAPKAEVKESVRVIKTSPLPQAQKNNKKQSIWNGLKEAFMPEAEEEESPKNKKTEKEGLPKIKINWNGED